MMNKSLQDGGRSFLALSPKNPNPQSGIRTGMTLLP
jgi:hypothetical protein